MNEMNAALDFEINSHLTEIQRVNSIDEGKLNLLCVS